MTPSVGVLLAWRAVGPLRRVSSPLEGGLEESGETSPPCYLRRPRWVF